VPCSAEAFGAGEGLKAEAVGLKGIAVPGSAAMAVPLTAEANGEDVLKSANNMKVKNGMMLQDVDAILFTIIQGWTKPLALQKGH
jgi:hypothetical protein